MTPVSIDKIFLFCDTMPQTVATYTAARLAVSDSRAHADMPPFDRISGVQSLF